MNRSSSVICGLIAACLLASCNGRGPQTPDDGTVDLSGSGTACSNCYLIGNEGRYSIDATVMGNGKAVEGLDAPSALNPAGARLVWQTSKGMIEDVRFEDGNISFEATGANGNALLAALDADGNIIWSWHIWFPEQQPSTMTTKTGYELMDMNLGAMRPEFDSDDDVKPYGLLYQWGRKDPFTNAPTRTGDTQTVGATVYDADGNEVVFGSSCKATTHSGAIPSDMKGTRTTPIPTRAANRIMTPALQATGYRQPMYSGASLPAAATPRVSTVSTPTT